jgi:hypothetical protein
MKRIFSVALIVAFAISAYATDPLPSFCSYPPTPDCGTIEYSLGVALFPDWSEIYIVQSICSSTGLVLCQQVERTCGLATADLGWPGCPAGAYCSETTPTCSSSARARSVRRRTARATDTLN